MGSHNQHKWMHPALTTARQAGTRFTYPGGMEGWVNLGSLIAAQPGIEPTTAWLQVRRLNRYATKPPNGCASVTCNAMAFATRHVVKKWDGKCKTNQTKVNISTFFDHNSNISSYYSTWLHLQVRQKSELQIDEQYQYSTCCIILQKVNEGTGMWNREWTTWQWHHSDKTMFDISYIYCPYARSIFCQQVWQHVGIIAAMHNTDILQKLFLDEQHGL